MVYVVWIGVTTSWGCGRTAATPAYAPVASPCQGLRVGSVSVTGAGRDDVAGLAVLEGTIDESVRTERIVTTALDGLHQQGYARAAIAVTRTTGCFTELHVAVTLGPRFKIDKLEFRTDDAFPPRERLTTIEDTLGTVNTVGGVYIEYRMQRALKNLEKRYHDAGWLEAKVGPATAHYSEHAVSVSVPITAGPRFRIGAIRARGATATARTAVLEEIRLEPGAWYDGPAIRSGIERARRKLDRWVELRTNLSTDRDEIELEAIVEGHP
jgi:outer membrane protein assembly factor BamA